MKTSKIAQTANLKRNKSGTEQRCFSLAICAQKYCVGLCGNTKRLEYSLLPRITHMESGPYGSTTGLSKARIPSATVLWNENAEVNAFDIMPNASYNRFV